MLPPQFWISVRGITSRAAPTALYGHWVTPLMVSAGFGVLALGDEGEVVVANLLNLKQPGAKTDVRLLDLVGAVDNGRSDSTKRSDVCVE